MTSIHSLQQLAADDPLSEALQRAARGKTVGNVSASVTYAGQRGYATAGNATRRGDWKDVDHSAIGCLTKAITASLISTAVTSGAFSLESPVSELLKGADQVDAPVFQGVTVRQLLNHTHGIDLSAFQLPPLLADGQIDVDSLCRAAARTPRISKPGKLYNYGNAGPWLAAGIAERHLGAAYEQLLRSLLERIGIVPRRDPRYLHAFCPSRGNSLSLSIQEITDLSEWFMSGEDADPMASIGRGIMPGRPIPLPGWSLERGCGLGWKYYGDGWFGHNALLPFSSTVVRFHLATRAGIAVSADGNSAALVLARMVGNVLAEFRDLQIPRPCVLGSEHAPQLRPGIYANAETVAVVAGENGRNPTLTLHNRDQSDTARGQPIVSRLVPCTHECFMLEAAAIDFGPWIQFITPHPPDGEFLWNGRNLLRRTD